METAEILANAHRDDRESREKERAAKRQAKQWKIQAAAERASKLAGKIDDPVLLLACLRFYASLPPGEWVTSAPIHERIKGTTRRIKNHCTAARRVLQVKQRDFHREMRMPLNWSERVAVIGLDFVRQPALKANFLALTADLLVDQATRELAAKLPDLIKLTGAFLRGESRQVAQPKPATIAPKKSGKSLYEIMEQGSDEDDDYYDTDRRDDREPDEQAFKRQVWLKARINAFLGGKS